ncbi:unnamed protein product [Coregonus sp. 'balchen']|nr:unnamed protein product [Coregonus sp. 'balchen']
MTAILNTDSTDKSGSLEGSGLEKGAEEVQGEPFEIMEKVKEDLEKVGKILRSGTLEGEVAEGAARAARMNEEWILLSECEIEEAKNMAALEPQEPVLHEVRVNRGIPRPKAIKDVSGMVTHLTGELKEYLLDVPEGSSAAAQEDVVQEKFTEVVLRKGMKRTTMTITTTATIKTPAVELKKPVRRKGKDQEQAKESSDGDALLSAPTDPKPVSPVSPVVEETPIGSIKDKVKALQQKVEAEQKVQKPTSTKTSKVAVESKIPQRAEETTLKLKQSPAKQDTAKKGPPKSPKTESEKLQETMSVRELLRSFQKGQDPSKTKSGLFELKTSTSTEHEITESELQPTQSKSTIKATTIRYEREVSLDAIPGERHREKDEQISPHRKHSKDFGAEIKAELEDNPEYQQFKQTSVEGSPAAPSDLTETVEFLNISLYDSSDSLKHEGVADSPSASLGDGSPPHLSSEDSLKHEGLATPGTSPDSISLSPKNADQSTKNSTAATIAVKGDKKTKDKSGDFGVGTIDDQPSTEMTLPVSPTEAADDRTTSESISFQRGESKPSKPIKLTKRVSETLESFLSDEESPDDKLASALAATYASSASTQRQGSLELPLKDPDAFSPLADESLTISHRDSLDEGSPLMEDNSSHRTPDSIEPSPTNESPCCDSLESSPVEQKTFPPILDQPSGSSSHPEPSKASDFPPDVLRSRLLRDQEASANDDDSIEQTSSQMESSGKSPLSPDTPSSEEVSYEVNPKTPDHMFLSVMSIPAVIHESSEEDDDEAEAQRKFTPEDKMFKMSSKIKTFEEMDQDTRTKNNSRKYISALAGDKAGDDSIKTVELESANESGFTRAKETSELALSVESLIKVQPPSPFPAGVHEGIHHTEAKSTATTVAVGGPQSVSEQQLPQSVQSRKDTDDTEDSLAKTVTMSSSSEGAANITDEQKEESLRKSRESKEDDGEGKEADAGSLQTAAVKAPCQIESNITDEVKGDHRRHSGAPEVETSSTAVIGQVRETFKPEICIYDDTEEDDEEEEPPRTESKGVTAREEADPWSAMREDDDAFAARVKEEEQKILGLIVDRQSQGATPDTTPGRSPTEESTPTSEPNPFLFQEGKLFEMTRSGAIDMTKRSYEDEGFAFFQIGEQPLEEALAEQVRDEPGDRGVQTESEVGLNLTLQIQVEEDEEQAKDASDSPHRASTEDDQKGSEAAAAASPSKSDASKSRIPRMGLSASAKTTKKDKDLVSPVSAEAVEVKPDIIVEETPLELETSSLNPMITNVETAVTTVTRSVYPEQDQESSDSSPEEQHSVIELPKTTEKAKTPTSTEKVQMIPTKTPAKAGPQSQVKTASSFTSPASPSSANPKKETPSLESKSRIPVKGKASPVKPEPSVKCTESSQDAKLKVPVKKDLRRKSETDTGPSAVPKTKTSSSKAKSFCEADKTSAKKDLGLRGKPGQTSHTSTTAKDKSEPRKKSIEFVDEISDKVAKLVERFPQDEKDKKQEAAAVSDDKSSGIDPSVIERETFPEMQFPASGDIYPIRPLWDDPVDTQMQRIPDDAFRSQVHPQDEAERKEEMLEIIADHLGFSWMELARELEFSEEKVNLIRIENPNSLQDQSHALLKLWTDREGKHGTETSLIKRLTKINRMDIVHLIETKIVKSTQEDTSSCTYAEIERTIALDHSEGFSGLHEDRDSPQPGRRTDSTPSGPGSRQGPLVVSEEDLSSSMASLHETSGQLTSHILDPVYKGPTPPPSPSLSVKHSEEGAQGGAEWGEGSTQHPQAESDNKWLLSPTRHQESPTKSRKRVCESRPFSMTDFGDSLTECDLAEPDFSELSVELKQTSEDYAYLSTNFVTMTTERVTENISFTAEPMNVPQSTQLPQSSEVVRPKETCKIFSKDHIDEVSHRLYKVLFGYVEKSTSKESRKTPMELDEVAGTYRASPVYAEDSSTSMPLIDVDQATLDQDAISTELHVRPVDISPMTPESITFEVGKESQTEAQTSSDVSRTTLISESVKVKSIVSTALIQMSHDSTAEPPGEVSAPPVTDSSPGEEYSFEITLPITQHKPSSQEEAFDTVLSESSMPLVPEYIASETEKRSSSPDLGSEYATKFVVSMHDRSSSPESLTSDDRSGFQSPDSPIPEYRPSTPDSSILLTESRASSPESLSSVTELSLLLPDSPIPHFRPMSPLPPPEIEWETAKLPAYAHGQMFLRLAEAEDRPLTHMVPNKGEFTRAISPGSERSYGRSISPESVIYETEDRASSPESVILETVNWLFPSDRPLSPEEYLQKRASSPESIGSVNEHRPLSPDSPVPEFRQVIPESIISIAGYRSFSPESETSVTSETGCILLEAFAFWQRPDSPESTGSVDEHRSLSPDSPIPQFWQSDPIALVTFCRSSSSESIFSDVDYETAPLLSLLYKDRPSSPESIASIDEYRALSPDSPIPQFRHLLPDSIVDYRSDSPESVSSDTEYVPISLEIMYPALTKSESPKPLVSPSVTKAKLPKSETLVPEKLQLAAESFEAIKPNLVMSEPALSTGMQNIHLDIQQSTAKGKTKLSKTQSKSAKTDPASESETEIPAEIQLSESVLPSTNPPPMKLAEVVTAPKPAIPESTKPTTHKGLSVPDVAQPSEDQHMVLCMSPITVTESGVNVPESPPIIFKYTAPPFLESNKPEPHEGLSATGDVAQPPEDQDMVLCVSPITVTESGINVAESPPILTESSTALLFEFSQPEPQKGLAVPDLAQTSSVSPSVSPITVSESGIHVLPSAILVPEYRLVYDAELWKLISQINDPQYVGETYCSKTGVFEYAGQRIEYEETSEPERKSLSIDSPAEECDSKPLSPESLSEYRPMSSSSLMLLKDIETTSPASTGTVNENRSLSPDSPIPKYSPLFCEAVQFHHRSSSPESLSDDEVSDIFESRFVAIEGRPLSPESTGSVSEHSSLSKDQDMVLCVSPITATESGVEVPESPPIIFDSTAQLFPESSKPEAQKGLSVPDLGQTPKEPSVSPITVSEEGIHVPPSVIRVPVYKLKYDAELWKLISPIHDPQYVGETPKTGIFEYADNTIEYVQTSERESQSTSTEVTEERPLSPDSESEYRPLSHESVKIKTVLRSDSAESVKSLKACQSLSPDSPILQYSLFFLETAQSYHRSLSSESVSDADVEIVDPKYSIVLGIDTRSSSPESLGSVNEHRPLSPDSPIPQFRQVIPESVLGYRSSSPESVTSVTSETKGILSEVFSFWQRPDSPESTASVDEYRCLSPDSPLPQYLQYYPEPTLFMAGSRPSSPASICSNMEPEMELFLDASMLFEDRPSSPDSIASIDEYRALSPDSPIPQFRQMLPEFVTSANGYRSASPESVTSDIEYILLEAFAFCQRPESPESTASVDEYRCLSPDSPLPQYLQYYPEPTLFMAGSRSSSPVSELSDIFLTLFSERGRPSSPESVASVDEYRPLSPDSPIPVFRQSLPESVIYCIGDRSPSPESMCSDIESWTIPLMSLFYDDRPRSLTSVWSENQCELSDIFSTIFSEKDRPSSPDSIASIDEYRALSSDSPIPQFGQMLPESVMSVLGDRSSSPESVTSGTSETEYILSEAFAFWQRPDSPESTASVDEDRCLSPDSPLPQYLQYFPEPTIFMSVSRPSSPDSVTSEDIEYILSEAFAFWQRPDSPDSIASIDEYRPLSPDSPTPQFRQELPESVTYSVGYGSSSPESVTSDIEYAPLISEPFFIESRPDSPESIVSDTEERPLSPESLSEYRTMSPESVMLLTDTRSSSPESTASVDEYRCLSPDSPIPEFRRALRESIVSMIGYRSSSPESLAYYETESETEYAPLISEIEDRPDSPDSTASVDEFRALSPDSPVPQYTQYDTTTPVTWNRSALPESIWSDMESEMESFLVASILLQDRCSSPESIASIDECRALAPDSPVPQFRQMLPESAISNIGYRSSSSEPVASDIEYAPVISESLFDEVRPVSPESLASVDEHRSLTPESPITQITQITLGSTTVETGYRSSSTDSITSDMEFKLVYSDQSWPDKRAIMPESVASVDEHRPLTPEATVPDYREALPKSGSIRELSSTGSVLSDSEHLISTAEYFATEPTQLSPKSIESNCGETELSSKSLIPERVSPSEILARKETDQKPMAGSPVPGTTMMVEEYNLVYDAELWKLSSQIHDPQYVEKL